MNKVVLIFGGYGVFGGRIAMALARDPELQVIVAGRNRERAARHCQQHGGKPMLLDCAAPDIEAQLRAIAPALVIDAAGPFQVYEGDPYRLVKACLAVGAHYLDLSDDAAFTAAIGSLNGRAQRQGLVVLSGVSTVPAISSAAVAELMLGMVDVHLIDSVILPGNRAPRGLSVVRAILAQVGKPLLVWRDRAEDTEIGWSGLCRVRLPGLGGRWASTIGAPDLRLFPRAFRARSVEFRAGLELSVMHLGLSLMAVLVRKRIIQSALPFAKILQTAAIGLGWFGSDRGGMRVRVIGLLGNEQAEERSWTIVAGAGHGPQIPALPALILTKAVLAAKVKPGARAAIAEITLAEVEQEASDFDIRMATATKPFEMVFPMVLGVDNFAELPPVLRDLHQVTAVRRWIGHADVTRGRGRLARLAGWIMGFPTRGQDLNVTVQMARHGRTETWTRNFGGQKFKSHLRAERNGTLTERFGAMRFRIALRSQNDALHFPVTAGWFLGVRIPRFLLPVSVAREYVDDQGQAAFDVSLSHPITGMIVHYKGALKPVG